MLFVADTAFYTSYTNLSHFCCQFGFVVFMFSCPFPLPASHIYMLTPGPTLSHLTCFRLTVSLISINTHLFPLFFACLSHVSLFFEDYLKPVSNLCIVLVVCLLGCWILSLLASCLSSWSLLPHIRFAYSLPGSHVLDSV